MSIDFVCMYCPHTIELYTLKFALCKGSTIGWTQDSLGELHSFGQCDAMNQKKTCGVIPHSPKATKKKL